MKKPSSTASTYEVRAKLWLWHSDKTSWHFISVPQKVAEEIRLVDAGPKRVGFGSLKVQATIGETTWSTSIFPSAEHKTYVLPVKASVRKAEDLVVDKMVKVKLEVKRAW
jgi:hypothetical protein